MKRNKDPKEGSNGPGKSLLDVQQKGLTLSPCRDGDGLPVEVEVSPQILCRGREFPGRLEEDDRTVIPVLPKKSNNSEREGQGWGLKSVHLAHREELGTVLSAYFM
jgi:hypothetical protein